MEFGEVVSTSIYSNHAPLLCQAMCSTKTRLYASSVLPVVIQHERTKADAGKVLIERLVCGAERSIWLTLIVYVRLSIYNHRLVFPLSYLSFSKSPTFPLILPHWLLWWSECLARCSPLSPSHDTEKPDSLHAEWVISLDENHVTSYLVQLNPRHGDIFQFKSCRFQVSIQQSSPAFGQSFV